MDLPTVAFLLLWGRLDIRVRQGCCFVEPVEIQYLPGEMKQITGMEETLAFWLVPETLLVGFTAFG